MLRKIHLIVIIIFGLSTSLITAQTTQTIDLSKIMNKKKIKIIVTDSGLGGVSVLAGLEEKFTELKSFDEIDLIYFNSHAEKGSGYNSMPNMTRKAEVFDDALESMREKYSPDLILIACNTLSVVYPNTKFATENNIPVLGIVDFGVEMIMEQLSNEVSADLVLIGTETTISSNTHKNKLLEKGIDESKILSQACPGLESSIQNGPASENTVSYIQKYGELIKENLNSTNTTILTALCCTHYGFSSELIKSEFKTILNREVKILNPNDAMINYVVQYENGKSSIQSNINVKVVSRAFLSENETKEISAIIKEKAPLSAEALLNYTYDVNLFKFIKE